MTLFGKELFYSFIFLAFIGLASFFLSAHQIYAASCPATSDTGVYTAPANDPNGNAGKCFSAHGQVGVNVNGLQYTCGPIACYNPNQTTHTATTPNTCVYYDPFYKNCSTGWGGQGFNPASGCHWDSSTSQVVACPPDPNSPVHQFPIYIHVNGLTQGTASILVNDNGYGFKTYNTDAQGNIMVNSFSGDFVTMKPGGTLSITPASITTQTNTNWQCGASSSNPCTFTINGTTSIKKYLCSNNACVEDDTNGTFTDSACGGKCTAPQTNLTLVLGLPGIGYDGGTPKHTTRNVTVELYDPTVTNPGGPGTHAVTSAPGIVTYDDKGDNNDGYFTSLTPISFPNLPTNSYQILVKMPQYLYKLAINASNTNTPTVFTLTQGTTTVLSPLVLVPGNVVTTGGHTNNISILDWNAIISCYGANQNTGACPSPIRPPSASDLNLADLNDDGVVDVVDLNLWLRSWKLLVSNNAPGCDTGSCQGD